MPAVFWASAGGAVAGYLGVDYWFRIQGGIIRTRYFLKIEIFALTRSKNLFRGLIRHMVKQGNSFLVTPVWRVPPPGLLSAADDVGVVAEVHPGGGHVEIGSAHV